MLGGRILWSLVFLCVEVWRLTLAYKREWFYSRVLWLPTNNEGDGLVSPRQPVLYYNMNNEYLLENLQPGTWYQAINNTANPQPLDPGAASVDAVSVTINVAAPVGIQDFSNSNQAAYPNDARILLFSDVYFTVLYPILDAGTGLVTKLSHLVYEIRPSGAIYSELNPGTDPVGIINGCGNNQETRIDAIGSSSREFLTICGKIENTGYLRVGIYWSNYTGMMGTKRAEFLLSPAGVNWTANNTYDLRGIRLDAHKQLDQDVLFYRVGTGIMYFNSDLSTGMSTITLGANDIILQEIRQVNGKFLMFFPMSRAVPLVIDSSLFMVEYKTLLIQQPVLYGKRRAAMQDFKGCMDLNAKIQSCASEFPQTTYLNHYFMPEENEYIFEFRANYTTTEIDVYRYSESTSTFEKIISHWPELVDPNAVRFTGKEYFIQVLIGFDAGTGDVSITVYYSPKRYMSKPRQAFFWSINFGQPLVLKTFYVQSTNRLYMIGPPGFLFLQLQDISLNITRLQIANGDPNFALVQPSPLPDWTTLNYATQFFTFSLDFVSKKYSHACGINPNINFASFFFQPSSDSFSNMTNTTDAGGKVVNVVRNNLPSGIGKDVDLRDLFKGSFYSTVTVSTSPNACISDSYLDPFVYKIRARKTKYMESIYGFDVETQSKRRIHLMISTVFDNVIYSGNRFQIGQNQDQFKNISTRDYRGVLNFYPYNATDAILQVQELTYGFTFDKVTSGDADVPSKGVNGVCANSSIASHDRLGRVLFCLADQIAYIKILEGNQNITIASVLSDAQAVLDTIRVVSFIKTSDFYGNYFFVFYYEKPDPAYPDRPDSLVLAIFTIENIADPKLAFVSKYYFPRSANLVTVLSVEIAGERLVHLERQQTIAGGISVTVYSILNSFNIGYLWTSPLPAQIALTTDVTLYLTDLQNDADRDNHLNTVISPERPYYQVSLKVMSMLSKEVRVLVINPALSPFDSMTLVQLPAGYQLIECGQIFISTKYGRSRSLGLITGLTSGFDSDYYSQDMDLYVFLISDMSPSLVLKPINSPDMVMNSQVVYPSNSQQYVFNGTTSIYTNSSTEEDRRLIASMIFDTSSKKFIVDYAPWGVKFQPVAPLSLATGSIESYVQIKTLEYANTNSAGNNLENFFFRLNPRNYVNGTIINYSGKTESTVEDFMGIVKVLPDTRENFLDTTGTEGKIRSSDDTTSPEFVLSWVCPMGDQTVKTYNNATTDQTVRGCDPTKPTYEFLTWREKIVKLDANAVELSSIFSSTSKSFRVKGNFLFYLASVNDTTGTKVKLCIERIDMISNLTDTTTCPTQRAYLLPGFSSPDRLSLEIAFAAANSVLNPLTGTFIPGTEQQEFIFTVVEYNKNIKLYSKVVNYYVRLGYDGTLLGWFRVGEMYLATDNVQMAYIITPSTVRNPPFVAKMFAIYSRWVDGSKITLFIDQMNVTIPNRVQDALNGTIPADVPVVITSRYVITLITMQGSFSNLRLMAQSLEIVAVKQSGPAMTFVQDDGTTTQGISFALNFQMGNSYLVRIAEADLNKAGDFATVTHPVSILYVVPVENPFLGFLPDPDTPKPFLFENYYFQVHNFKQGSYFLGYKIDNNQAKRITNFTNVMGIDEMNLQNMATKYADLNNYAQAFTVSQLTNRPILFTVLPNFNARRELEHKLVFVSSEEKLVSLEFTSFINVRVQTHRIASRMINMTLRGTFNQLQPVVLRVSGEADTSWGKNIFAVIKFALIFIVALGVAIAMMYFIDREMQINWSGTDNKIEKVNSKFKPISRAVSAYFTKNGPQQTSDVQKEQEDDLINSSEDSGEEDDAGKKPQDQTSNSLSSQDNKRRLGPEPLSSSVTNKLSNLALKAKNKADKDKKPDAAETGNSENGN